MTSRDLFDSISPETIDQFIADQQEENLHLEFKLVGGPKLTRDDRRTLARAISGFANADGGIIVWGVDARPNQENIDCANAKRPIESLSSLIAELNLYTGQAVNPIVDGVQHRKVTVERDMGFAITLVPASDAGPHMAKLGEDRYFKRSGGSFAKLEHFDIEDMFGRRKRPRLSLSWQILQRATSGDNRTFYLVVAIENSGRGSARSPYLGLHPSPPYAVSEFGLDGNRRDGLLARLVSSGASDWVRFGGAATVVIHPNTALEVTVIRGKVNRTDPKPPDLAIDYEIGAEDSRLVVDRLTIDGASLKRAVWNES